VVVGALVDLLIVVDLIAVPREAAREVYHR
jgi:hypothetical protein